MHERLLASGRWDACYELALEVAAMAVEQYVTMAETDCAAGDLAAVRAMARGWLVEMTMVSAEREHLGPVDAYGRDSELMALVKQ